MSQRLVSGFVTHDKENSLISASGEIERHGIESIPDKDRTATIVDFMRIDFMRIDWGGTARIARCAAPAP